MLDGPANNLRLFRDNNLQYPAWNIEPSYKKQEIPIAQRPESIEITDRGPVAVTAVVRRTVHHSPVSMQVRLFAGRPLVDVAAVIDWREKKAILKAYCHSAINTERVACEIPYGAIERASVPRNKFDRGRWEQNCQKWISVSDGRYGLAVLNEGKYGFDADGGTIGVTLLRGPQYPGAIVNAWGLSQPLSERPRHTDQGMHVIRWGIMPHAGDWRAARLWRAGLEFNNPPLTVRTSHHGGIMPVEGSSLRCDAATTYVAAVKRPEDNPGRHDARYHQLVVRLVESAGAHDTVRLEFAGGDLVIDDVKEMDLLEFNSQHAGEVSGGAITLEMKPFEIKTIKVTLAVKPGGEGTD
jgi:alpha-mannosidase